MSIAADGSRPLASSASSGSCCWPPRRLLLRRAAVSRAAHPEACQQVLEACAKDMDKGLDLDDLRRGLHCQGLYPSWDELQSALEVSGIQLPVPAPLIMKSKLTNHLKEAGCRRGLRAVPHAWRGVRLGQLQELQRHVVESLWLGEQCRAHNEGNKAAIQAGKAFAMEENLYALDRFFVRAVTDADPSARSHLPPELLRAAGIPAAPAEPCSYSQLLNPEGLGLHVFVSHFWGHPLRKTVASLALYAQDVYQSVGKDQPSEVVFWICLFALNQHRVMDELGPCPMAAPFNIAVTKARAGVVMVLDTDAAPLTRIWCLFEVARANDLGQPMYLLTEKGLAGESPDARHLSETLAERLRTLSALEAESSAESDKLAIWSRIVDQGVATPQAFKRFIELPYRAGQLNKTFCSTFDERVRELLATPLLKTSLAEGSAAAALKYIAMGARCTASDFVALDRLGQCFRSQVPCHLYGMDGTITLPWLTARAGLAEALRLVLERKGDVELPAVFPDARGPAHAIVQGTTPLMMAGGKGHMSAVQVLLEHRASVHTKSPSGKTALTHVCMRENSEKVEIVRLLLDLQAEVDVGDRITSTPLHWAAGSNAIESMELLIARKASVNVTDEEGASPLHVAACHGYESTTACLLAHRADPGARKKDGCQPLHRAAALGQEATTRMLLESGVELLSRNNAGKTAEELASAAGHTELSRLLSDLYATP